MVKVEGIACRRIQDGTGWVVADDLVVTNAHVVAGERSSEIQRDDDRQLAAAVVAFDPERDLALLHVKGLDRPALPMAAAARGQTGGVFGHPGGEPLRIAPFSVARQIDATGRDIYDGASTRRQVLELAAGLRPGDSGSALIDPGGEVIGIAFAISTDQAGVAYALATSELTPVARRPPPGQGVDRPLHPVAGQFQLGFSAAMAERASSRRSTAPQSWSGSVVKTSSGPASITNQAPAATSSSSWPPPHPA